MNRAALRAGARPLRTFRVTTKSNHRLTMAENVLNRGFSVAAANRVWASDITYVATAEGCMYLRVVRDLYSFRVVGWSMGRGLGKDVAVWALLMAAMRRRPPRELIVHSDRGVQYCSHAFRQALKSWGMRQSTSGKGECWDNACAEFFNSLKTELTKRSQAIFEKGQ